MVQEEEQWDEGVADAPRTAGADAFRACVRTAGIRRVFDKLEQVGVPRS